MLEIAERPAGAETAGDAKVCPVTGVAAGADITDRDATEWLVATAIRCRLAGYEFGDINCWELGNALLEERLGPVAALVEAEIASFVRRLRGMMTRPLAYHPHPARALAGDEAILLDVIAHAGADHPDALRLAAALTPEPQALVALAKTSATRLAKAGLTLKVAA